MTLNSMSPILGSPHCIYPNRGPQFGVQFRGPQFRCHAMQVKSQRVQTILAFLTIGLESSSARMN
jgi:hypothetical protein